MGDKGRMMEWPRSPVPYFLCQEFFVISLDADDPLEVHKFCSMLPAFTFEARPVAPVADAIRVELEAMAYRDGLKK
jgi:hypothetical protein